MAAHHGEIPKRHCFQRSLEKFTLHLRAEQSVHNAGSDWALIALVRSSPAFRETDHHREVGQFGGAVLLQGRFYSCVGASALRKARIISQHSNFAAWA
jgi:hypothetical protein